VGGRLVLTTLAAAAAFATSASAAPDFAAIDARIDERAATTSGALRAQYAKLHRLLARADAPGLADDFAKLKRVARAARGPLSVDDVLAEALHAALDDGLDAIARHAADLDDLATALDSVRARKHCRALAARASRLASAAAPPLLDGRDDVRASLAARAAAAYDVAVAWTSKFFARQNARPPAWSVPLRGLGGALLSSWTTSGPAPEIYVVGAADGAGPLFLHMRRDGWVRVPVAASGTLWWTAGVGDQVYASGTGGRVIRHDPASGDVIDLSTGVNVTLYGVWGSSTSDVWAVGGNEDGTLPRAALLHHDGVAWTSVPLPDEAHFRMVFKVWGRAADDVWVCGQAGLLMHFDGLAWTVVPSGTFENLFTVHGAAPTVAVGGTVTPTLIEGDGSGFVTPTIPSAAATLRGVHVVGGGDAWACGLAGTVLRRTFGIWIRIGGLPDAAARDFHSVRVDDVGGVYFAGGDLARDVEGVLFYFGPRALPSSSDPKSIREVERR